jgi:formiminotetrahydrofolate cyclodeaminase
MEFEAYLDALASAEPTPGGGSAAAVVGALAAALCAMVARITLDAPKLASVHEAAAAIVEDADDLRRRFVELRPQDEAAYRAVVRAQALPRGTDGERAHRRAALQQALAGAAEVPLEAMRLATDAFALAARTAELHNANLMSDVDCAMRFARAAFEASIANVEVNHQYITDLTVVAHQRERVAALDRAAREFETRALAVVLGRRTR